MLKIKGLNDSLVLVLGEGSLPDYLAYLQDKLDSNPQLFRGSQVFFQGEGLAALQHEEIAALQRLCLDYGMIMNNTRLSSPRSAGNDSEEGASPAVHATESAPLSASPDTFLFRNLRSGQRLHSEGTAVVWGDVHESAEITAAEDIIVLGKLGGIAHAGCYGDESRIVFALNLTPTQIRIGSRISRSSGDEGKRPYPEIACLENGEILIREYVSQEMGLRFRT